MPQGRLAPVVEYIEAMAPDATRQTRLPTSPRGILSVVLCLVLAGWALWVRIPAAIYGVYLGGLALMILTWGVGFERSFLRAARGAALGATSMTFVAFFGMLLPNAEHRRQCAEPGMYCEDFSGAMLVYGAPFVLLGVPLLTAAVHAVALGLGRLARRVVRSAQAHGTKTS
jgi:hypothetical protein